MNKSTPLNNNEIDVIALFRIIWNGKIKILLITIISLIVGFGYNSQLPNNFLISLSINTSNDYQIQRIENIENLIKLNQLDQLNEPIQSNKLDNPNLLTLEKFIFELKDYEEFLLNLKKTKKIQESISKLKIKDQEKKLFGYAKLLKIKEPEKKRKKLYYKFLLARS